MSDHASLIRTLGQRLTLPLPSRTRLVEELRGDLDGLTASLVASGLPAEKARARAAEVLLPDDSALSELERMEMPLYGRITDRLDASLVRRLERLALGGATLALLAVEASALLGAGLLDDPSPFLWPILVLGAVLFAVVLAKAFELWIKGAHENPRRGIAVIAALTGSVLSVGGVGCLVDLLTLAATMETGPPGGAELVTGWLIRDAALLSTAIIVSAGGGIGWLVLSSWTTVVEQAHRRAMAFDDATADDDGERSEGACPSPEGSSLGDDASPTECVRSNRDHPHPEQTATKERST